MSTYDRAAIDLTNERSSWTHVVRAVGRERTVLDLGCWDGLLLHTLRAVAACRGVGLERDRDAAARARARGLEVVEGSLDDPAWPDALGGRRFDVVVLADVLEHTVEPVRVLRAVRERCLAPGGRVVVSVPNMVHGSVRLSVLSGEIERRDAGLLDRTHLHLWTRRGLLDVVGAAGLATTEERVVERPLDPDVVAQVLHRGGYTDAALARFLVEDPSCRAFQYVWTLAPGVPAPTAEGAPPAARDALRAGDRVVRRQAQKIRALEERVRVLEQRGPWRFVRYVTLRWRQRRERRAAEAARRKP